MRLTGTAWCRRQLHPQASCTSNRWEGLATTLLEQDQPALNSLLLRGTISANLPFSWVNNHHFKQAFALLNGSAKLPSSGMLSGRGDCSFAGHVYCNSSVGVLTRSVWMVGPLLEEEAEAQRRAMAEALAAAGAGTLCFDSGTNINRQQIMAFCVVTAEQERQVLPAPCLKVHAS